MRVLVDLAREGFTRGWDNLDRADKHDEIAKAIGGVHAEWLALVEERDTLKAEVDSMKRGYVDLHQMLTEPRNADVWTKVDSIKRRLLAYERVVEAAKAWRASGERLPHWEKFSHDETLLRALLEAEDK
ncbi:MAG: hypothetical protein AB7P60_21355 [Hyphomicrobiaceae bacterium]